MVKIKEGYVMNTREQREFDHINALPRKTAGKVDYYYKPQTKYPPRIYVFMHAETWCDRNRRPMGLFHAYPFLSRPMNREEIEYHHFDTRLCYHQYENWDKLMYAEEKEAAELDLESPGTGTAFLQQLESFQKRFPLAKTAAKPQAPKQDNGQADFFTYLLRHGGGLNAKEIGELLEKEQHGLKRLPVLVLLRELYNNTALPEQNKIDVSGEIILRKVKRSEDRSRRNFVRRVYRRNKLFALAEIRGRYADYTELMLAADLQIKSRKIKKAKTKPVTDLRRSQLEKLAARLRYAELPEAEYHHTCCRIALMQLAHNARLPIPIAVTFNKETLVYYFDWRTRENIVKAFAAMANTDGMTHEQLKIRHNGITSSNYSF